MTVRCVQCGQENNPQYRFCGMCGAPLGPAPAPIPPQAARERARGPVSGPSFLGLGDESSRDLDYLLEDEPPRGHGRLYFALLLLVVSAALLAWHWQRDGYPWAGLIQKPATTAPPAQAAPAPPTQASAPPAVIPVEPTANPAPPESQPASGEATPPAVGDTPAANTPPAAPAAKPAEPMQPSDAAGAGDAAAKAPATEAPQATAAETAEPERKQTPAATSKKLAPKPSTAAPADTFEDRLVADGERYLYGRGVPEDCDRAQRNLQIAARQSNPKAQTLLGAMYATGHCVGRDLPSAYRWFAKALHGDPGNSRVQRDLEVLWKQMTPEERLLAMKSQ
jgi:Sel1 repeat